MPEARIARDVLGGAGLYARPDAVLVVVDACNLTRNLVLVGELLAYGLPVVVALNMVDLAQQRGLTLDAASARASTSVARSCRWSRGAASGLDEVRDALGDVLCTRPGAPASRRAAPPGPATHGATSTSWADRRRRGQRRRHARRRIRRATR